MVIVAGLERMSFEVLRVLRGSGATVHCILNSIENHRIVPLAQSLGATWSTGRYRQKLSRHTVNPLVVIRSLIDILLTSAGMLRDAVRFRPTHVFVPEYMGLIRNAPAILVLRLAGVKIICRLANHPDKERFYEVLFRYVLPPLVTTFVTNSRFAMRRLEDIGVRKSKIRLIQNTLSTRGVATESDERAIARIKQKTTILSVGQLAHFKGTHIFVAAAISLALRHPGVQAIIVGRRPEWPPEYVEYVSRLETRITEAGLSERIVFAGELENIPAVMRESALLALPILQEETFGNVALEALSVGLPVVAFATGGLPELVEHGKTGYLCNEPTVDCLVEGIEHFLANPEARASARTASLARINDPASPFSREHFTEEWQSLFSGHTLQPDAA